MKTDEIKSRITIYDILNYYNIKPDRHGFFCCPFHAEKTPSVKLYDSGRWKCFGCGKSGDLIDFVAAYEKTDIPGAIQIISDRFGLELDKPLSPEQKRAYIIDKQRRDFITAVNASRKRIRADYAARLSEQLHTMRNDLLRLDPLESWWWELYQKTESLEYIVTVISGGVITDKWPDCELKTIYGTDPDKIIFQIFTKQLRLF